MIFIILIFRGNGDKEILESPNRVQSQHVLEK